MLASILRTGAVLLALAALAAVTRAVLATGHAPVDLNPQPEPPG
jgi:hypothetical protein